MGDHDLLDIEEWELVLNKMLMFHFNVSEEIKSVVQAIRQEMKPELIPLAEDKATFGKSIKMAIREMWSLEYEIEELQSKFSHSIGTVDLENLDVDFIEDMMLKSKPLQSVLCDIRSRQKVKLEETKKAFGDQIKDLEPKKVTRPPKAAPVEEKPAEPAAAAVEAPAAAPVSA
jgi:hypothetical protein